MVVRFACPSCNQPLEVDNTWAGQSVADVSREEPDLWRTLVERPHEMVFPEGESLAVVQERVMRALEAIRGWHPAEMVVVVGHQLVNRVILCSVLDLGLQAYWRIGQETCCINQFHYEDGIAYIDRLNGTCHLTHLDQ